MSNRIEITLTGVSFSDHQVWNLGAAAVKLSEVDGYPDPMFLTKTAHQDLIKLPTLTLQRILRRGEWFSRDIDKAIVLPIGKATSLHQMLKFYFASYLMESIKIHSEKEAILISMGVRECI